jgi:hypothetical protein
MHANIRLLSELCLVHTWQHISFLSIGNCIWFLNWSCACAKAAFCNRSTISTMKYPLFRKSADLFFFIVSLLNFGASSGTFPVRAKLQRHASRRHRRSASRWQPSPMGGRGRMADAVDRHDIPDRQPARRRRSARRTLESQNPTRARGLFLGWLRAPPAWLEPLLWIGLHRDSWGPSSSPGVARESRRYTPCPSPTEGALVSDVTWPWVGGFRTCRSMRYSAVPGSPARSRGCCEAASDGQRQPVRSALVAGPGLWGCCSVPSLLISAHAKTTRSFKSWYLLLLFVFVSLRMLCT